MHITLNLVENWSPAILQCDRKYCDTDLNHNDRKIKISIENSFDTFIKMILLVG